jgi:hypothetical protein
MEVRIRTGTRKDLGWPKSSTTENKRKFMSFLRLEYCYILIIYLEALPVDVVDPNSRNSARWMKMGWKLARDARMLPPIQIEYFLSGRS